MNSKNTNESVASSPPVKHSVMIVTDNSILIKILGKFIISKGYNYIPVLNPKTAPDSIKALKPDVILVYISMENLNMLQVIDDIRNQQINIPIIVISDQIDKKSAVSLSNYNISGIFIKPFNLKKLDEKIKSLISPETSVSLTLLIISDNEKIREELDT
ncbi:MAG: response regulator, partial [Candidatus Heimdallarchaeota archaeon]|nr:response regulator [Candidatus Heimdallarchaeota archaeon]